MLHSCGTLKNPSEPCLGCMYGVDNAIPNGLSSTNKMMIALATLAVGGGVALYLYNKKDKKKDEKKEDKQASADDKDGLIVDQFSSGVEQQQKNAAHLMLMTGQAPLQYGNIKLYRYTNYLSDTFKDIISKIPGVLGDDLGSFTDLAGSTAVVPLISRLGLAKDLEGPKYTSNALSSFIQVGSINDQAMNRKLIFDALNLNIRAIEGSSDNVRNALFDVRIWGPSGSVTWVAARVAAQVCVLANQYWINRKNMAPTALGYVKESIDEFDIQRISAAVYWAILQSSKIAAKIAQGQIFNFNDGPGQYFRRNLGVLAEKFGLMGDYYNISTQGEEVLYSYTVKPNADLVVRCQALFMAWLDGVFNCENPQTNDFDCPNPDNIAMDNDIETKIVNGEIANAGFLAGVVFHESNK